MPDPFAPFPTTGASWIDPTTGRPAQGATPPPGVAFRSSALLQPDENGLNTRTAQGDANNAFRGYDNGQGGGFGATGNASVDAARKAFDSIAGMDEKTGQANSTKLGDTSSWTPAQWDAMTRQFGGIGNRDQASITAGLSSDNPYVRETAQAYQDRLHPAANPMMSFSGQAAPVQAEPAGPPVDTDPYGRNDDPAHPTHGVITPQTEAQMGTDAMRLPSPIQPNQLQVPGSNGMGNLPTGPQGPQPAPNPTASVDPFSPFRPGFQPPQATDMGGQNMGGPLSLGDLPTSAPMSYPPGPTDQGPTTVPGGPTVNPFGPFTPQPPRPTPQPVSPATIGMI